MAAGEARDRTPTFGAGVRAATPLFIWAAHFAFCYLAAEIGCPDGGHGLPSRPRESLQTAMVAATLAALGVVGWMLWRGCRALRATGLRGDSLVVYVRPAAALLSLAGIAWVAVVLLMLPACP